MKNNNIELKKDYLEKYEQIKLTIKVIELTLSNLKDDHERALDYIKMPKAVTFDYTVNKLSEMILHKENLCIQIIEKIELMDCEDEKNVLLLKYINGYTFEEISDITNFSLRQVYYIYKKALKNFEIE